MPGHIGIIMDGNGRWARKRGMPRKAGHIAGVKTVKKIVEEAVRLKIKYLTLYTFSKENWKRPRTEVSALMNLLYEQLIKQKKLILDNRIKFKILGETTGLPDKVRQKIQEMIETTKNFDRMTLNLALNYGSRQEIMDGIKKLCRECLDSGRNPDELKEESFSEYLYTSGQPDPDLIIRTSGEYRISNFLLWQAAYSEFYFTSTYWPDFNERELRKAIQDFQKRLRRFGGVDSKGNKQ